MPIFGQSINVPSSQGDNTFLLFYFLAHICLFILLFFATVIAVWLFHVCFDRHRWACWTGDHRLILAMKFKQIRDGTSNAYCTERGLWRTWYTTSLYSWDWTTLLCDVECTFLFCTQSVPEWFSTLLCTIDSFLSVHTLCTREKEHEVAIS